MAYALRQAARENFTNPVAYLAGAAGFGLATLVTHVIEPNAGMLFGAPFISIQRFTYYLFGFLGDAPTAKITRAVLSYFSSIAVGMFITSSFGFSITLAESALLTLATWILGLVLVLLANSFGYIQL